MLFRKLIEHSTVAARIYSKKKTHYIYNQSQSMSLRSTNDKEKELFRNVLPAVLESITSHPGIDEIPDLKTWMEKLFKYNLTGGKGSRGLSVITAYKTLEKPEHINEKSMHHARVMGWCVEMFQAYLVVMDDMMDGSPMRRGQQCWHVLPAVGTSCAMNDAILLYNGMLYAMQKYFGDRENYKEMLNTMHETMFNSAMGQYLDLKTSADADKTFSTFTPKRHHTIVKYKTAYYTYDLPIYLGFLLTGNKLDGESRKQVQDLCLELGILFQIQDDYIDCYSDSSITGKAGTDIEEGKCSWLAVNALQRCTDAQKIVFRTCYGSKEPAHIERVKVLYNQLGLPKLYKEVEKQYYDDILERIRQLPSYQWRRLFHNLLGVTYGRQR